MAVRSLSFSKQRGRVALIGGGGLVLASMVFYLSGALGKTSVQQP